MTATINATYTNPDGSPVNGTVYFRPDVDAVFINGVVQANNRIVAQVVDGAMTVELPATDVGNPRGWTYRVTEFIKGGRVYHIQAPTGTWDLTELAPVAANEGSAMAPGTEWVFIEDANTFDWGAYPADTYAWRWVTDGTYTWAQVLWKDLEQNWQTLGRLSEDFILEPQLNEAIADAIAQLTVVTVSDTEPENPVLNQVWVQTGGE